MKAFNTDAFVAEVEQLLELQNRNKYIRSPFIAKEISQKKAIIYNYIKKYQDAKPNPKIPFSGK